MCVGVGIYRFVSSTKRPERIKAEKGKEEEVVDGVSTVVAVVQLREQIVVYTRR